MFLVRRLDGSFPKEMLVGLKKERSDLAGHIRSVTLSDDQLNLIEGFYARIRKGSDQADFNAKRQIVELLDVRGNIALENGEKRLYLRCLVDPREQQPLWPMLISPSSNSDWQNLVELTARFVMGQTCP